MCLLNRSVWYCVYGIWCSMWVVLGVIWHMCIGFTGKCMKTLKNTGNDMAFARSAYSAMTSSLVLER